MVLTEERYQMFIGGRKVDAAEGETEPIINPATGKAIPA
jgi:acyl-CoA reductase-like NAD-dependent aldehyde dehydrogenase